MSVTGSEGQVPDVGSRRSRVRTVGLVAGLVLLSACQSVPKADVQQSRPTPPTRHPVPIVQEAVQVTTGAPLIDPAEVISGGPEVDGIPAIDQPVHVSAAEASRGLVDTEQVLLVSSGEEALAFPLRSLIQHEIANDELAGVPIAATWCPLCNTGVTYDRRVAGSVTTFGVSGTLYRSAMVMYDRTSRTLWTQPTGKAVLGSLTGAQLITVPSSLLPWAEARRSFPAVVVVLASRDELSSATNPYQGYDTSDDPFLFRGRLDDRLPPFERVAGVSFGGTSRAWTFSSLRARRTIDADVGGQALVVLWAEGTSSPLDSDDVRKGREIGSTGVYDPVLDGRRLTFVAAGRDFRDTVTGSTWTLGGVALDGPLRGRRLTRLPSQEAFWFAWAAFNPTTELLTR